MRDKIALLMEETGCGREEAELALEMCAYDVERAVAAIPRLFQNIAVVKGRARAEEETLHLLFLAILDLRRRSLLRARAVASYNPAVCAPGLELHWFEFEKHLYASRLRGGSVQGLSLQAERALSGYFGSQEAAPFYAESPEKPGAEGARALTQLLARRLHAPGLRLSIKKEVLDMGQFRELGRRAAGRGAAAAGAGRRRQERPGRGSPPAGPLVVQAALQGAPDGPPARELRAGDVVYARITDTRDIAQYLARLLGAGAEEGAGAGRESQWTPAPVEAVESTPGRICVRVRFSPGVCGDAELAPSDRLRAARRRPAPSWWKKWFRA